MNSPHEPPMDGDEVGELQLLCSRYVDGELGDADLAAFERRMLAEPEVRAAVDALRATSGLFAPEREAATPKPSKGFAARVMAEARRLPTSAELQELDVGAAESSSILEARVRFEAVCRRLVIAAALLMTVGALAFGGLLQSADTGELEATPEDIRTEMNRLDALITEKLHAGDSGRLQPSENR